jgi:uncharacterized membrane protein
MAMSLKGRTIMDVAQVLAVWLHTLAFVVAWGYYGILGRVVLPSLERSLERPAQAAALVAIERRAVPLVVLSLALFTATGSYLLVVDPQYTGLGDFFASTWTTLMLVKHALVVGLVALGVYLDRIVRHLGGAMTDTARASAIRRVALSAETVTGLGALVALLTAAAQVAG